MPILYAVTGFAAPYKIRPVRVDLVAGDDVWVDGRVLPVGGWTYTLHPTLESAHDDVWARMLKTSHFRAPTAEHSCANP